MKYDLGGFILPMGNHDRFRLETEDLFFLRKAPRFELVEGLCENFLTDPTDLEICFLASNKLGICSDFLLDDFIVQ